jgi:hypothetical protein
MWLSTLATSTKDVSLSSIAIVTLTTDINREVFIPCCLADQETADNQ